MILFVYKSCFVSPLFCLSSSVAERRWILIGRYFQIFCFRPAGFITVLTDVNNCWSLIFFFSHFSHWWYYWSFNPCIYPFCTRGDISISLSFRHWNTFRHCVSLWYCHWLFYQETADGWNASNMLVDVDRSDEPQTDVPQRETACFPSTSAEKTMKVLHWCLSPMGSALLCPQGR